MGEPVEARLRALPAETVEVRLRALPETADGKGRWTSLLADGTGMGRGALRWQSRPRGSGAGKERLWARPE
eukprot:12696928-Alexandrium_andersonii.AAC.1